MRKIIYYVATSVDGYIAGTNDDVSGFAANGKGVEKYLLDLQNYDTVIMGRRTYEFGYKYGLQPGEPAYPHMEHYIFSETLSFDEKSQKVHIRNLDMNHIRNLKNSKGSDIYLCGGGVFAGWLLENEMIDVLKVKLNPLILGKGIPMFRGTSKFYTLILNENESFVDELQIMTYQIVY